MTTKRKPTAKPSPAPIGEHGAETLSATGADIIDGAPYFATLNGQRMNRRQYLDATKAARKAAFIAALTAPDEDEVTA